MSASRSTTSDEIVLSFEPRGAAREIFTRRDAEVVLSGPAGTGKTRANLEKLHLVLATYPNARGLMLRKTHASLTSTALVTYQQKVLHALDAVKFYGGSAVEPPQFRYPNGSRLMMGGMDKPLKIMSGEYDLIYVCEATELSENDWESLTTRLRNGMVPYQQIFGDCNPDAPTHWLKRRADEGRLVMLESRHEDNPAVTPEYLAKLDALTGVRFLRLRKGIWAAAEGMVYDGWDRAVHIIDRFELPRSWPRYWVVDFGYTNPFVWQCWAEDPDGRLYREWELYMTQRLVADHAEAIRQFAGLQQLPRPLAIICDHDAEDRATLERALGMRTLPAFKAVSPGIQAVAGRLRVQPDSRARLFYLRDSLIELDQNLAERGLPTCTEDEIEGYVWDESLGRKKGEEPVKRNDHGMDATRYLVAFVDDLALQFGPQQVIYDAPVRISPY